MWPEPTWTPWKTPAYRRGGFPPAPDPVGSVKTEPGHGVTVTTIHQAKGREWDVVIVGSLDFDNREVDPAGRDLAGYAARPPHEPPHRVADYDHARQHYVAFSRAKNLLVADQRQERFTPASPPGGTRSAPLGGHGPRPRWGASGSGKRGKLPYPGPSPS